MSQKRLAERIGFMQGRLVPPVGGRINAFPAEDWREEFAIASDNAFGLMEWTIGHEDGTSNPLMTSDGRLEIRRLSSVHSVQIRSLTGDCFMQAPFWKANGTLRDQLEANFLGVVDACHDLGVGSVMVPLVDEGSIKNVEQESRLIKFLQRHHQRFLSLGIKIILESDFAPDRLGTLIDDLPRDTFGVNYDIGNSAAHGYEAGEETRRYGERIMNVHVKDRRRGGATVPLGQGAADVPRALRLLLDLDYAGAFILQTARAEDGDDVGALCHYRDMTLNWLEHRGS